MAAFMPSVMPSMPSLFSTTKQTQRDRLQNFFSNKKESLCQKKKRN